MLLRWSHQKGYVPVVKMVSRERMKENMGLWELRLEGKEMKKL